MRDTHRFSFALALGFLTCAGGHLPAGDLYNQDSIKTASAALPKPAEVQALAAHPELITLKGMEDAQQLILTATLSRGRLQDLTGDVKYQVADPQVVKVTPSGRVLPVGNGATEIAASYGD